MLLAKHPSPTMLILITLVHLLAAAANLAVAQRCYHSEPALISRDCQLAVEQMPNSIYMVDFHVVGGRVIPHNTFTSGIIVPTYYSLPKIFVHNGCQVTVSMAAGVTHEPAIWGELKVVAATTVTACVTGVVGLPGSGPPGRSGSDMHRNILVVVAPVLGPPMNLLQAPPSFQR